MPLGAVQTGDPVTTLTPAPPKAPPSPQSLRIVILSYRSTPHVGGQGVYVDYVSRALVDLGHKVDVISGPPYPELDARVNLIQLPSLDLYAQPHNGHFSLRWKHLLSPTDTYEYFGHLAGRFVEPFTFGQRAYAYLKSHRNDYDVVLDNQTLSHGTSRIEHDLKIPMVTVIHHPITADRRLALEAAPDWKHRWLIRQWYGFHKMQIKVAQKAGQIVCPSLSTKNNVVEEFEVDQNKICPIRLGVDRTIFKPASQLTRRSNRLITTASADVPLKGLPYLIHAYNMLLKQHPDLELVVIGKLRDGPAKDLINELELNDRIEFKSGLTRAELAREFQTATLAITPSLYEGFGLPAAEAMSCGTAVVVTDGGSLPEVAGNAGVVVPRADAQALAIEIDDILVSPDRRTELETACLKRAETHFDWSTIAPLYIEQFERAIAKC